MNASYLKAEGVVVLSLVWAVHGLNPMEYLLRFLKVRIQGKRFYNANDLFEEWKDIYKKIPLFYVMKLIDSKPTRCQMLCNHYGYPTKY